MPIDQRSLISAAKRLARIAGAVYLLIVFVGAVARLGVRAGIRVPGFAAAADSTVLQVSLIDDIALAGSFRVRRRHAVPAVAARRPASRGTVGGSTWPWPPG